MKYASIGSISHGTMRNEDLLETFADELESLERANGANTHTDLIRHARAVEDFDSENASHIVEELFEALDEYVPPYCYFGAHEGDGSDYGFWPLWEAIDELPKVSDPAGVDAMGEDCAFINDHGNVTLYGADGSVIWDIV